MKNIDWFQTHLEAFFRFARSDREGNSALSEYLAYFLEEEGFLVKEQELLHAYHFLPKHQKNIYGILGDPLVDGVIPKGLLLGNHLERWFYPPSYVKDKTWFWQEEDAFLGIGLSAKIDYLCQVVASKRFLEVFLKEPIYLSAFSAHQVGFLGERYLLESKYLYPKTVLLNAPTDQKLAHASTSVFTGEFMFSFPERARDAKEFYRKVKLTFFQKNTVQWFSSRNCFVLVLEFLHQALQEGFLFQVHVLESERLLFQKPFFAQVDIYLPARFQEAFRRFAEHWLSLHHYDPAECLQLGTIGPVGLSFIPHEFLEALYALSEEMAVFCQHEAFCFEISGFWKEAVGKYGLQMDFWLEKNQENDFKKIFLKELKERFLKKFPWVWHFRWLWQNASYEIQKTKALLEKKAYLEQKELFQKEKGEHRKPFKLCAGGLFQQAGYPTFLWGNGNEKDMLSGKVEKISYQTIRETIAFYEKVIQFFCVKKNEQDIS